MKNKPSRVTLVLYAVCALIWTIRAIFEVIYQTYNDSVFCLDSIYSAPLFGSQHLFGG